MDKYVFFRKNIHRVSIRGVYVTEYRYWEKKTHRVHTRCIFSKTHTVYIHGVYFQKNPNKYGYQISRNLVWILGAEYPYSVSIYSGSNIYIVKHIFEVNIEDVKYVDRKS